MKDPFLFNDKAVFVAGGTSGINKGVALKFAELGARVCVISRSEEKVEQTVEDLNKLSPLACFGYTADVRDTDRVKEVVGLAAKEYNAPIDFVISGAAGNFPAKAKDMSYNAFKSVIDIDLLGTFNVLHALFPYLKKPGASIINISAPQAFVATELQSHVCAAKSGVDMITKSLALEWGKEGIRINSVVPGPIAGTEGMKRLAPTEAILQKVKQTVPLSRHGTLEDIANACVWLSSSMASYVNGIVLPIDGGWSLSGWSVCAAELTDIYEKFKK